MASKPTIIVVAGVSGSGKTWVCSQLLDKYNYISYDKNPKKDHLHLLRNQDPSKITLYDLAFKTSTFVKRHSNEFDIRMVIIMGDFLTVKQQLINRGGKITKSIYRRWKIMKKRSKKYAEFTGSSSEVLKYLRDL